MNSAQPRFLARLLARFLAWFPGRKVGEPQWREAPGGGDAA
jgi:hypothetical protein